MDHNICFVLRKSILKRCSLDYSNPYSHIHGQYLSGSTLGGSVGMIRIKISDP